MAGINDSALSWGWRVDMMAPIDICRVDLTADRRLLKLQLAFAEPVKLAKAG